MKRYILISYKPQDLTPGLNLLVANHQDRMAAGARMISNRKKLRQ